MLKPDEILQNRYCIVRELSEGGQGKVYEAKDQRFHNNRLVAAIESITYRFSARPLADLKTAKFGEIQHVARFLVMSVLIENLELAGFSLATSLIELLRYLESIS